MESAADYMSPELQSRLMKYGIDPALARAKLAPYADTLTPGLVTQAMQSTTWSDSAGGGARLNHMTRYLDRETQRRADADERKIRNIRIACANAASMAKAIRERVEQLGIQDAIRDWARRLDATQRTRVALRVVSYLKHDGSPEIARVVTEKYVNSDIGVLLDVDWLAAIGFDDARATPARDIITALRVKDDQRMISRNVTI